MSEQTPPENEIDWGNFSDWESFSLVQRDICYLYHELAQGLDDLSFGTIYNMPYWDFLGFPLPDMPPDEKYFIRSGCLVMIHAMAWDMIIGAGFYVRDKIPHCQNVIARLEPEDENMARLIEIVTITLDAVQKDPQTIEDHEAWLQERYTLSNWVTETFVLGYYKTMFDLTTAIHSSISIDGKK